MQRGQEGTCPILSSEPDLIAAHAGHSIDVAQHWEADEAWGGGTIRDPRSLGASLPLVLRISTGGEQRGSSRPLPPQYLGW